MQWRIRNRAQLIRDGTALLDPRNRLGSPALLDISALVVLQSCKSVVQHLAVTARTELQGLLGCRVLWAIIAPAAQNRKCRAQQQLDGIAQREDLCLLVSNARKDLIARVVFKGLSIALPLLEIIVLQVLLARAAVQV